MFLRHDSVKSENGTGRVNKVDWRVKNGISHQFGGMGSLFVKLIASWILFILYYHPTHFPSFHDQSPSYSPNHLHSPSHSLSRYHSKETIPPPYSVETWKRARRNPQSPALCDRFLAKQILCHSVLRSHAVYCVRSCCFRSLPLFCSLLRFHGSGCLYHLRQ